MVSRNPLSEHGVNLHVHLVANLRISLLDNDIVNEKRGGELFRIEDLRVKSRPGNFAPIPGLSARLPVKRGDVGNYLGFLALPGCIGNLSLAYYSSNRAFRREGLIANKFCRHFSGEFKQNGCKVGFSATSGFS